MLQECLSQIEASEQSFLRFKKNREREWGLFGHDTGLHDLNMLINGWIPCKVTTIAARSGMGKTALTVPFFEAGARVLNNRRAEFIFFSWEMTGDYIVDRHICYKTKMTTRKLVQGSKLLSENDLKRVYGAYKEAKMLPVTYQHNSTNIQVIKALYLEFCKKVQEKSKIEGVEIIPVGVIDYVGMAKFDGEGLRTYGIADFMNGVKQLANETGGAFCVFAQINRTADGKECPDRSDLSDSQSIENASDNLIIMHRPEYHGVLTITDPKTEATMDATNKVLFRVVKGRDFGTGDVVTHCDIKRYSFWSMLHDEDYKYWEDYSKEAYWRGLWGA